MSYMTIWMRIILATLETQNYLNGQSERLRWAVLATWRVKWIIVAVQMGHVDTPVNPTGYMDNLDKPNFVII